jgi:hypothetical protein
MLKNLRMWLDGHPHFNVEAAWGPLVVEWVRREGGGREGGGDEEGEREVGRKERERRRRK